MVVGDADLAGEPHDVSLDDHDRHGGVAEMNQRRRSNAIRPAGPRGANEAERRQVEGHWRESAAADRIQQGIDR